MSFDPQSRTVIYAVLTLTGLFGAVSDVILNQWARTGRVAWLLAAWLSWIVVATLLGVILRMGWFGFGAAVVLFLLVNSGGALILDRVLYNSRLTPLGWTGVALALAAILCIELGRDHSKPGRAAITTSRPAP